MPDSRFAPAYQRAIEAGRSRRGLKDLSSTELVAALAVARSDDPFANALATELHNRLRRGPFLGVAISSAAACLSIFVTNWIDAGAFLFFETGTRPRVLDVLALVLGATAVLAWIVHQGAFPRLAFALRRSKGNY